MVALQDMPRTECVRKEFIKKEININDLFGFFYCEIETTEEYLGLLPYRYEEGIMFPNGKWRGWYFSEELKYAQS